MAYEVYKKGEKVLIEAKIYTSDDQKNTDVVRIHTTQNGNSTYGILKSDIKERIKPPIEVGSVVHYKYDKGVYEVKAIDGDSAWLKNGAQRYSLPLADLTIFE